MTERVVNIPIIDTHHHLWDLEANYYPWLTDRITNRVCGEYSAIRKNYLLEDFLNDSSEVNLKKTIHVQAECNDPIAETKWLEAIAESEGSKGIPQGIVAYVDLGSSSAENSLEIQASHKRVVGIRQMLHESQLANNDPTLNHMKNSLWIQQFRLLEHFDLTFDLQVYPEQYPLARTLLKTYPNVQFVLCHTGQPVDQTESGIKKWKDGMQQLATHENLAVKISGLGMFDRNWTIESICPFVEHAIESFGTDRCMFGSNFPVDGMMTNYTRLWTSYMEIVKAYSQDEQNQLFNQNAERIYLKYQ